MKKSSKRCRCRYKRNDLTRAEKMATTMFHFHTVHGMPESVIWGTVEKIIYDSQ